MFSYFNHPLRLDRGATVFKGKGKLIIFREEFFKVLIHVDDKFAHDSSEGDLGGFALIPEVR